MINNELGSSILSVLFPEFLFSYEATQNPNIVVSFFSFHLRSDRTGIDTVCRWENYVLPDPGYGREPKLELF
jgi:hypothetical protein